MIDYIKSILLERGISMKMLAWVSENIDVNDKDKSAGNDFWGMPVSLYHYLASASITETGRSLQISDSDE